MQLTNEQVRVLGQGVRADIMSVLGSSPMSVGEIAETLDRSPKALYHHLRLLEEVGLVRVAEVRRAKRRMEAVYARVPDTVISRPDPERDFGAQAKMAKSLFRSAGSTYERALHEGPDDPDLLLANIVARTAVRLPKKAALEDRDRLTELLQWIKSQEDRTTEAPKYLVTIGMSPIKPQKRARRTRRGK